VSQRIILSFEVEPSILPSVYFQLMEVICLIYCNFSYKHKVINQETGLSSYWFPRSDNVPNQGSFVRYRGNHIRVDRVALYLLQIRITHVVERMDFLFPELFFAFQDILDLHEQDLAHYSKEDYPLVTCYRETFDVCEIEFNRKGIH